MEYSRTTERYYRVKYISCPKQYQAEQSVVESYSNNLFTILGGESQAGKTTVAKRLLKNADRSRVYTAYVPGAFTKLYNDVYLALSSALGLPLTSDFTSFRNIEPPLEDLIGDREFRVVFDDASIHFGGDAKQRNASISLMQSLIQRFPNLKILLVSNLYILDGPLNEFIAKNTRYVEIGVWQYDQQYRNFITKAAETCGFKRSQLSNADFIKGLLDRSHGASGALFRILQTLARNPRCQACKTLPVNCLHNMWKF